MEKVSIRMLQKEEFPNAKYGIVYTTKDVKTIHTTLYNTATDAMNTARSSFPSYSPEVFEVRIN